MKQLNPECVWGASHERFKAPTQILGTNAATTSTTSRPTCSYSPSHRLPCGGGGCVCAGSCGGHSELIPGTTEPCQPFVRPLVGIPLSVLQSPVAVVVSQSDFLRRLTARLCGPNMPGFHHSSKTPSGGSFVRA